MRRLLRTHRPSLSAVAIALLAAVVLACGSDEEPPAENALALRWLAIGEDLRADVEVFDGQLPADLGQLLNPEATEETPQDELLAVPVHPQGAIVGSVVIERPDDSVVVYLIYDIPGEQVAIEQEIAEQLDRTPWQVVGGQSDRSLSLLRFQNTRTTDVTGTVAVRPLDEDVRALFRGEDEGDSAEASTEATSAIYVVEIASGEDAERPEFELGEARPLPEGFPAEFLIPPDSTVIQVQWATEAGNRQYQLTAVSPQATSDLAEHVRTALEDEGWEIVSDEAVGFATVLEFAAPGGEQVGTAQIDEFPPDDSLNAVVIQLQSRS